MYRSLLQRNSKVCPYHAEIDNNKKSQPSFRPNAAACSISRVVYRRVSFMVWEYVAELPIRTLVDGLPFRKDTLSAVITVHSDSQCFVLETICWSPFILNKP
ncbi:hypothetical protein CDAR_421561 [Caerostris darwini]|uniref:Uncharacterized protein n=1 Tax=Caerostris darwini TaxID=1538125 RepID=A0AAV4STQ6_9ARAC|nr:hypothetical protein CDAR_421561 [Caerostris darwini]